VEKGVYRALQSERTVTFRKKEEQLPQDPVGREIVGTIYECFRTDPYRFEGCAARIWQMGAPPRTTFDLTRPSRDGGRDAIGTVAVGPQSDPIQIDYALEAKCYAPNSGVTVSDVSRLISRLRYRQFGVLVTTSYVGQQAYEEIRSDQHPVVVVASRDVAEILRAHQLGNAQAVQDWLHREFPS
jgi:hypothetical protein